MARRGGGFAERTILSWAKQYVQRRMINADPAAGTPFPEADGELAQREARIKVELKEEALRKAKFDAERERGRYVPIEIWEAELGERARVFRVGLEKFGSDMGVLIASDFGGSVDAARELVCRLGIDGERAKDAETLVIDFVLSRVPLFSRRWMDRIDRLLDPYSTDQWWTEDMREAFALYSAHRNELEKTE